MYLFQGSYKKGKKETKKMDVQGISQHGSFKVSGAQKPELDLRVISRTQSSKMISIPYRNRTVLARE